MPNFEGIPNEDKNQNEDSPEFWFELAQDKVLSFLPELDMDLNVGVETRTIYPYQGEPYEGIVLSFEHDTNPGLIWTMDIGLDRDYIENDLENVVRNIYQERLSESSKE
jgi:hypothetical protein